MAKSSNEPRPRTTRGTPDPKIGANVARARKAAGLTQLELARAMTRRGHKFLQQTVQKIESGTRSVDYEEIEALTDLLRANILEGSEVGNATATVVQQGMLTQARAELDQIRNSTDRLERLVGVLQKRLDDGPAS